MSQAFCQQCGTRRENDASADCATCGAPFPSQQTMPPVSPPAMPPVMPPVPEDEAPTRIRGQASHGQAPVAGQPPTPGPPGSPWAAGAPQQQWQQWQQPGYGQQQPGMQQWSPTGPAPQKSNSTKLWILIAVAVLVISGGIATALALTLGGDEDGGGGGGSNSASDTEQIEQVVEDYNDAFQSLISGNATACDDIAALGTDDLDESELQSCRESVTGSTDTGNFESTMTFKDATVDGDTAVAQVETSVTFGDAEPSTSTDDLNLRKIDGDWKIDYEASRSDVGEPSEAPSFGSE